MPSLVLKTWALAVLLIGVLGAHASSIPDAPIAAIEPGLTLDLHVGGEMGWIDNRTLLVTTHIEGKPYWEQKVVLLDVQTGEVRDLLAPGSLICTNAAARVVGAWVGSKAKRWVRNSAEPDAQTKLFSWSPASRQLRTESFGEDWNHHLCMTTRPEHVRKEANLAYDNDGVLYLEAKDTYLRFPNGASAETARAVVVRGGRQVAELPLNVNEIAMKVVHLPFLDGFLLSPGTFVTRGSLTARAGGPQIPEIPMLTTTRSGGLKKDHLRPLFESAGLVVKGASFPYAKGVLVFVEGRPREGGGIYLNEGKSLKRIWCTDDGNSYNRTCRGATPSILPAIAPDGCHFAFFAEGSDNPKSRHVAEPTLKVLPLCR